MNTVLVRQAHLDWYQLIDILLLKQYNTRVVVLGVMILGVAAGLVGTFLLLRKRSLFGDAISHASLPGICISYLIMVAATGSGKNLVGLLGGALVSGLIGMGCILLIIAFTSIKEDTAIGIVLSVFFGSGIALMGIIQKMSTGSAAGLESYIYGKTASMIAQDAIVIAAAAVVILLLILMLIKELNLATFDPAFAASEGYPVLFLDLVIVGLAVLLTVIGLQAVGLILIIALLIIPASAARFWTERLSVMLTLSCIFGAASGYLGASLSASIPNLPAGAIIVITSGVFFVISMLFGKEKGLVSHVYKTYRFDRAMAENRMLITFFRLTVMGKASGFFPFAAVTKNALISQSPAKKILSEFSLHNLQRKKYIEKIDGKNMCLTPSGFDEAQKCIRNHELQHIFLRAFPELAQGLHRRDEAHIEDFIGDEVLTILQNELKSQKPELYISLGEMA